jgi:RNA polymerase primary sigma factor
LSGLGATATDPGTRGGKRERQRFEISGEESVINFIKCNGTPPTQDIKRDLAGEGRGGTAGNALSKLDFCHKTVEGPVRRISLAPSLFEAEELAQALNAKGGFDVKTDEPTPPLEASERLKKQFRRVGRKLRTGRGRDRGALFREIERHDLLLRGEEEKLRRQFSRGERHEARDKLVLANLRLVVRMADRYRGRGVEWDDLFQEGVCGLMRAADKYDLEMRYKFGTYAGLWVMKYMKRAIAEDGRLVGAPVYLAEQMAQFRRFREEFLQDHGFASSDEDVRDYFGFSDEETEVFRRFCATWAGRREVNDQMAAPATDLLDQEPADQERCETIERVISGRLNDRAADIVRRRFGLGGRPVETLEQIGESHSLTRERVRQVEEMAIAALRHPKQARQLEPHVYP